MPNHEMEGVKDGVKDFMPATNQVVAREDKDVPSRGKNSAKLVLPVGRVKRQLVPLGQVVVEVFAPTHLDVASGVLTEVVWRISTDEVDGLVRQLLHHFSAVSVNDLPTLIVVKDWLVAMA